VATGDLKTGIGGHLSFALGGHLRYCVPDTGVDICENTGTDDCPDTVHVSASGGGGIFDGLEQDITRTDPDAPHNWGVDDECSGCAFIFCDLDGKLKCTLRNDTIAPACRITFVADGTGPCPTGRTWTYESGEDEGCDIPTSLTVT
jgi:hypothetical protein